ncbi:MAG: serine/threonine-protein phosphatase [Clostridia bacterium]|nr:serine/threonine-protein phosphatase [Clostridia bacterium]
MDFISHIHTDIGIKKSVNQDAALVMQAKTDYDDVMFCVLCDGMGGLANGEIASATVIKAFADWFEKEFPEMLYGGFSAQSLEKEWSNLIFEQNVKIMSHSRTLGSSMGTTAVILLISGGNYYIMNVGDSRAYVCNANGLVQITEDQTFVNREIKRGNMTPEQAKTDPRRNVLLQCVGASQFIEPDFFMGNAFKEDVFMMCSDGFRHVVTPEEIQQAFSPQNNLTEEDLAAHEKELVELNKARMENDNITALAVKLV